MKKDCQVVARTRQAELALIRRFRNSGQFAFRSGDWREERSLSLRSTVAATPMRWKTWDNSAGSTPSL